MLIRVLTTLLILHSLLLVSCGNLSYSERTNSESTKRAQIKASVENASMTPQQSVTQNSNQSGQTLQTLSASQALTPQQKSENELILPNLNQDLGEIIIP